jgi:hypothetical protein
VRSGEFARQRNESQAKLNRRTNKGAAQERGVARVSGRISGRRPSDINRARSALAAGISKIGDSGVRSAVYEAAHCILTKPVKGCARLKRRAMKPLE